MTRRWSAGVVNETLQRRPCAIAWRASPRRSSRRYSAAIVHVYAFRELGLERIYVPPRRDNVRVHALNAFLGYARDDGERARAYADADSDAYSLGAETFRARHGDAWREVAITRG